MRFTPLNDKQIAENGLFVPGEYDFEVIEAIDAQSAAGNDMVRLKVRVFNAEGQSKIIDDYLVATPKAMFKVKHFADAVQLGDAYEAGEMESSDMLNRAGRCKVIIKKDASGQYPDKNAIGDYISAVAVPVRQARAPAMAGAGAPNDFDDEVPF